MRPIASLTATARKIANTRDPSMRVPQPESDDEVAELALTLDQMLRELDAARTETDQMIQAQREFVADASHELRTPLTSILANLELLQARLDAPSGGGEEGEIIDGALRSSRRMGRLVSDLLLLARADAGRTGVRRTCDLCEIAEAAVAEVRPMIGEHRIRARRLRAGLRARQPRRAPPARPQPPRERAPPHSAGHVVVASGRAGRVAARCSRSPTTGPGFPAGMNEQIFARFVRGSGPADMSANGGTGLGLAIVQAVATSHGGEVEAGASAHGGALFTVRLPLEGGPPAPAPKVPANTPANI